VQQGGPGPAAALEKVKDESTVAKVDQRNTPILEAGDEGGEEEVQF
jgi:hypothetical protein